MQKLISLLILSFLFTIGYSQNPANGKSGISGKVVDQSGNAISFANVAVYKKADSSLYTGVATDMNGKFSIALPQSDYYLKLTFLSYKPKTIGGISVKESEVKMGKIQMQEDSKLLDEVEIVAERSQMELKLDKRVFNVNKDLSNAGSNAADILDNLPSVQVDVDGNVSLRGSENVRVLIDGKPSTITAGSVGEALRQFQGNMIESVEVITNPSSRYDAEGEVGIINIILKKDKQKGINGSVEAVAGYPENFRGSFNLNFRSKKFNFFTSAGTAYDRSPGGGYNNQEFSNQDTSYLYESDRDRVRGGISHNIRVGSDWFINDKNTITVAGFYRRSDEENISELSYRDLYSNGELFQRVDRKDTEAEDGENFETSINYTKTFDKEDQKLTFDLQWSERSDLEESDIVERNFTRNETLLQETSNLEANRTYLIQGDYVHPISKDGRFETGFRTTLRTVENDFIVQEKRPGASDFSTIERFNNDFVFNEDIFAYYAMFGNKIKNFSYQLGVRAEYSDIRTELKKTDEKNKWEYLNFFPSAHFTYRLENGDDLQLSYSRRINRPRFRALLPFSNFSDQRNLWRGNPELQPEYTDSYELGYLKYFEKGSLFSSVYYRYRDGVIDRITTTDNQGITYRLPVNLSVENNFGFEFNGSYNFNKKNSLNGNFNFYRSISEGSYEGVELNNDVYTWNSRLVYKSEILPEYNFQTAINYRAPRKTNQGRVKSIYFIDLSVSKDVLKGKGTVVASVRDLLNSRKYRSITDTENLYSESEFQWRVRQFLVTFTYRINRKKDRGPAKGGGDFNDDDF